MFSALQDHIKDFLQADIHAAYGGVVPNLAMEAHKAAMDSCVQDALQQAGVSVGDLQAIAVSIGPGLSPCLHVSILILNCKQVMQDVVDMHQ